MTTEFAKLIPELARWNNGTGTSLRAWMYVVGRYDHMLGFADIFWPEFHQVEQCIFRYKPDLQNFEEWKRQCKGKVADIESVMNHLHLRDLLASNEFEPSNDMLRVLGETLQQMWSCKLERDFPTQKFKVDLSDGGDAPLEYVITFFQRTP